MILIDCLQKTERLAPELKSALIANAREQMNAGQSEIPASVASVTQFLDITRRNINTLEKALRPEVAKEGPTKIPEQYQLPEEQVTGPLAEEDLPWTTKRIPGESADTPAVINLDTGKVGKGDTVEAAYKDAGVEGETDSVEGYLTDENRFSDGSGQYLPLNTDQTVRFAKAPPKKTAEGPTTAPVIPTVPQSLLKSGITRFHDWATDVLIKNGYPGLGRAVNHWNDLLQKYKGRFENAWRNEDLKNSVFAEYQKEKKFGDKSKAQEIYNNAGEKTKRAIDLWNKQSPALTAIEKNNNTKAFDPRTGTFKPYKEDADFPLVPTDKVKEIIRNPADHKAGLNKLRQEMIDQGLAKDVTEADKKLDDIRTALVQKDQFSAAKILEDPNLRLPKDSYDFTPKAATDYLRNWSENNAYTEAFGQRGGKSRDLFDLTLERAKNSNEYTREYISTLAKRVRNDISEQGARKVIQVGQNFTVGGLLGNWRTAITNAMSAVGFGTTHFGGPIRTTKALFQALGEVPDVYDKGIIAKDLTGIVTDPDTITEGGKALRVSDVFKKVLMGASFYDPLNKYSYKAMYLMAKEHLNDSIKTFKDNPHSNKSKRKQAQAKRFGINDYDALMAENGQGELTDRYLRGAILDTMGSAGKGQAPLVTDNPTAKVIWQFSKITTQLQRNIYNNVFKPGIDAASLPFGIKKGETVPIKDPTTGEMVDTKVGLHPMHFAPAAAMLIIMSALGIGRDEFFRHLLRKDPEGASLEEIIQAFKRSDPKALNLAFWRLSGSLANLMTLGAFGYAYDKLGDIFSGNIDNIPILSQLKALVEYVNSTVEQGRIIPTSEDTGRFAGKMAGIIPQVSAVSAQAQQGLGVKFPIVGRGLELETLRADAKLARNVLERWSGTTKERPFEGRWKKNLESHFKTQLRDALSIGDEAEAKRLVDEQLKDLTGKAKKEKKQQINSFVISAQPVSLKKRETNERGETFMEYAQNNLTKGDFERVKTAVGLYHGTARKLHLLKSGGDEQDRIDQEIMNQRMMEW